MSNITKEAIASKRYPSKRLAQAAARRTMRRIHGQYFMPKSGVDFTVSRAVLSEGWRFEIINLDGHLAEAQS
ncbi:hypothetical protein [Thalassospira povalilytica]|uniref:hypothetical protein n=1 Tax=Thalassospira povalilytica TaxID=732237 RepID=UPI001D18BE13|nr:hypothetical protein [Thalassospira povalilytica]MCC4240348.1 hypothetical protein [Thalassospira povalilytica]